MIARPLRNAYTCMLQTQSQDWWSVLVHSMILLMISAERHLSRAALQTNLVT